jgi:hypothetical protein
VTEADEAVERLTAQLNHLVSLESVGVMVKTTDLAAVLARAARVAELEAALAKANEPHWFYSVEDSAPEHSLEDAIEEFCDYLEPGWHFVEIDTARPCKTIRGVVHILTDDEVKARGDDEPWVFTPCATEAEARALLKEAE